MRVLPTRSHPSLCHCFPYFCFLQFQLRRCLCPTRCFAFVFFQVTEFRFYSPSLWGSSSSGNSCHVLFTPLRRSFLVFCSASTTTSSELRSDFLAHPDFPFLSLSFLFLVLTRLYFDFFRLHISCSGDPFRARVAFSFLCSTPSMLSSRPSSGETFRSWPMHPSSLKHTFSRILSHHFPFHFLLR